MIENLPGDWEMLENSLPYEKLDANTVRFSPKVPAGGKATLAYQIQFQ